LRLVFEAIKSFVHKFFYIELTKLVSRHVSVLVKNCEGVNARYLTANFFDRPVQFISGDLSFISLKLVIKSLCDCLCDGGEMVLLIKPQFEAGKQALNKKGIVKDRKDHVRVITELLGCFRAEGLAAEKITISPVKGGDGIKSFAPFLCSLSYVAVVYSKQ